MLSIELNCEENETRITLEGSLNSNTAGDLKEKLNDIPDSEKRVVVDAKELKYVASAGLRVILALQKKMDAVGGQLILTNVSDNLQELFEDTGFVDFLTIE